MTLTPLPDLFNYIGFTLTLFSALAVASIFVFRRRPNWQRLRAVNFLFPLIPSAYVLVGTGMVVYGLIFRTKASLASLATIAAGGAVYHLTRRRRSAEMEIV